MPEGISGVQAFFEGEVDGAGHVNVVIGKENVAHAGQGRGLVGCAAECESDERHKSGRRARCASEVGQWPRAFSKRESLTTLREVQHALFIIIAPWQAPSFSSTTLRYLTARPGVLDFLHGEHSAS